MIHVLLLETIENESFELLKNEKDIQLHLAWEGMPAADILERIDAVITRGIGQVNRALYDACPNMKVAARCGVGLDNVDVAEASKRGIRVINAPGSNASTVAEHTISLMLTIQRNLFEALSAVKNGNWASRSSFKSDELNGKTLGILGLGNIGLKVANIAAAFGMKVIYWSPSSKEVPYLLVDKETLFRSADIISLHLPLNEETKDIVDEEVFNKMNQGTILINTARGALVNRDALLSALDTGKLAGYGADVPFSPPPTADDALISHPKSFITAHVSSLTATTYKNMCLSTVKNVLAVLHGQAPDPQCIFNATSLGL
ncbi:MAG: phosphoglycerate dehydrogenase [Saprospiraceae bacterium]|nr:phosphoglycerate dehydrogenase [Saprospiraceae bacterium]